MLTNTLLKTINPKTAKMTSKSVKYCFSSSNKGIPKATGLKIPFNQLSMFGKGKRVAGWYFWANLASALVSGTVCYSAHTYNKYMQEGNYNDSDGKQYTSMTIADGSAQVLLANYMLLGIGLIPVVIPLAGVMTYFSKNGTQDAAN